MKNFVKKFNVRYSDTLHEEQRRLLNKYVLSFSDNGLVLKAFLHEEIERLRTIISRGLKQEDISSDKEMTDKTKQVLNVIDGFSKERINNDLLERVMKIQSLAREIEA